MGNDWGFIGRVQGFEDDVVEAPIEPLMINLAARGTMIRGQMYFPKKWENA